MDIETVSQQHHFSALDPRFQELWAHRTANGPYKDQTPEAVYSKAGLYAEFGKILCISVGVYHLRQRDLCFRVKSFADSDERMVLTQFADLLQKQPAGLMLCGHNIKVFDLPFICRRMLINGMSLPGQLDLTGKKPWEINHLDTMELWRFGDFRNFTSLDLLATVFGIPSSKDDISGEDIHRVYYEENNLERIRVYCEKDVVTTAQVLRKIRNEPVIEQGNISFA